MVAAVGDDVVRRTRAVLSSTARARLVGRGRSRCFRQYDSLTKTVGSLRYSGLTKRLERMVFSKARLPIAKGKHVVRTARERRRWRGALAGFRRGADIDRELARVANGRVGKLAAPKGLHRMTRLTIAALYADGLRLVCAQHPVVHEPTRMATAVDLLCIRQCNDDPSSRELVLVEVKTGYDNHRMRSSYRKGAELKMRGALSTVPENWCNRHLAQLASTWRMFVAHEATIVRLKQEAAIRDIGAMLLYVTERDIEAHALPDWWATRSAPLVDAL